MRDGTMENKVVTTKSRWRKSCLMGKYVHFVAIGLEKPPSKAFLRLFLKG